MTVFLEWGGDFEISQSGGIVMAGRWDSFRQSLYRFMLTNKQQILPDGSPVAADLVFYPDYGIGLRKLVNKPIRDDYMAKLRQSVLEAVQAQPEVDPNTKPTITLSTRDKTVFLFVFVKLKTGESGRIALQVQ